MTTQKVFNQRKIDANHLKTCGKSIKEIAIAMDLTTDQIYYVLEGHKNKKNHQNTYDPSKYTVRKKNMQKLWLPNNEKCGFCGEDAKTRAHFNKENKHFVFSDLIKHKAKYLPLLDFELSITVPVCQKCAFLWKNQQISKIEFLKKVDVPKLSLKLT